MTEKKPKKKIISIDLDGVLNDYKGNYKNDELAPIKEGAYEFLEKLSNEYSIEIYTVRDIELCTKWFIENNLMQFIYRITNTKNPRSSVFLDDRALYFDGDFNNAYANIKAFKPFWKNI